MSTFYWGFISFLLLSATQAFSQTELPNAKDLLARLADSVRESNYQGRMTYEHSGVLEVMEIAHSVIDDIEYERVEYLNGPNRALVQNGRKIDCITYGGRLLGGGIVELGNGEIAELVSIYELKLLGTERVAGHDSWVVQLSPKDKYRHSYIFAIDKASYLPTKMVIMASGRNALERLHFVSLETNVAFTKEDFGQSSSDASFVNDTICGEVDGVIDGSAWRPSWVPPGFVLSRYHYSEQDGHMETYTDGLASFSVFTKPVKANDAEGTFLPISSSLKKGATVVVMRLLADSTTPVHVSVLGEIPSDTANRILSSVKAALP